MRPEFLAELISRFFDAAVAPLTARLAAVEARPLPEKGDPGLDGKDGTSVTIADVRPMVDEYLKALPVPKDGASVTVDDVKPMIMEYLKAIPVPKDGEPGKSVTIDEVRNMLSDTYASQQNAWALDFERRAHDVLHRAIDKIPAPKDGADGFSLDDLQIEDDGEGTLTLRFVRGDLVRERTVRIPSLSDRGVFREGTAYRKGDGVSFGGSFWIAQKDAPEGKPGTSPDWRLAVKKGRDGRDRE
jgi:hypothetical protein